MNHDNGNNSTPSLSLASLLRGLYSRVARDLEVDASYVSRVARGERSSAAVQAALGREMKKILALAGVDGNGTGSNGNHNGHGQSAGANRDGLGRTVKSSASADRHKKKNDKDAPAARARN
jgi:hypothetical protein